MAFPLISIECCTREWGPLDDMRLSALDANSRKSMNTQLHLMEACTNLVRATEGAAAGRPAGTDAAGRLQARLRVVEELATGQFQALLRDRLRRLIDIHFDHIIDPRTHHLRLFFDDRWNWADYSTAVSYGHDIEASWLMVEAAGVLGDAGLLARARGEAVAMASAVREQALNRDGSIIYEAGGDGERAGQKHWWAHAEAVVGFYSAYQISGEERFAQAAGAVYDFIDGHFVDRAHGDWFKVLVHPG